MSVRVITPPAVEPVTLAEVKLFLRESATDQDAIITALIISARQYAENYCRRALVYQELELCLPAYPSDSIITLPRPPLQSVRWVKYINAVGVLTTVDPSEYQVNTADEPGQIRPTWQNFWKVTRYTDWNAVQVRYYAGYAGVGSPDDYAAGVPASIKHWMKVRIAQLYEHREAVVIERGSLLQIPQDYIDGILDPFKTGWFG